MIKNFVEFLNENQGMENAPSLVKDFVLNVIRRPINENGLKINFQDIHSVKDLSTLKWSVSTQHTGSGRKFGTPSDSYYTVDFELARHSSDMGSVSSLGIFIVGVDALEKELYFDFDKLFIRAVDRSYLEKELDECFDESLKKHHPTARTVKKYGL
jgi:hypothetical protein